MSTLNLRVKNTNFLEDVTRAELIQENNAIYGLSATSWSVHDAMGTRLPATAAADDLGCVGVAGTNFVTIQTSALDNASVTQYAATTFTLPPEYVAGQTVLVRISGGTVGDTSSASCTVDIEAWPNDGDTTMSADICTTVAQSINSETFANKDFTLTPTSLSPGDEIMLRITIASVDSGAGTAYIAAAAKVAVLLDIKG